MTAEARDLDQAHARPAGTSDETVAAVGKLAEMVERVERARGALYEFHQLLGGADAMLDEVVAGLRAAGHERWAGEIETELIGRNVLAGRWSFQVVEEFDDDYHDVLRATERAVRNDLMAGRRHVFEAEMKQRRRSAGRPQHEATPTEASGSG